MSTTRLRQIRKQLDAKLAGERQLGRDCEQVAQNLHALVRAATGQGARRKQLALDAGLALDAEQAVKKLDEITIPPSIDKVQFAKRRLRLQKKPNHYVSLAMTCAKFLGLPEDQVLLRLFDGTDYGSNRTVDEDDYDPTYELVHVMREHCDEICRNLCLNEYWGTLLKTKGRYDPRVDRIIPQDQDLVVNGEGLKGSATCVDEMVPLPSVSLVRRPNCYVVGGTLWVAPEPEPEGFDPRLVDEMPYLSPVLWRDGVPLLPEPDGSLDPRRRDYSTFIAREATFSGWLDIRLAVGPQLEASKPIGPAVFGPLLELRSEFEARLGEEIVQFDNPFWGVVRWAIIRGRWYKVWSDVKLNPDLPGFNDPFFDMPHEWYFAWGELSATSLDHVLSAQLTPDVPLPYDHYRVRGEELLSTETLLRAVEIRIRDGATRELADRARELCTLLSDFRKSRVRRFRETSEEARESLKAHLREIGPVTFDN